MTNENGGSDEGWAGLRHYDRRFQYVVDPEGFDLADSFGITERYENRILDLTLPEPLPQIVLVTGESGCGKTTLLKTIAEPTRIDLPEGVPLYRYGKDLNETLGLLSFVGIGDATLFLTDYRGLSDSQQARARIAKAVLDGEKRLVFDEFLATLDRQSAKIVAFNFQRFVRKLGLSAIVATSHADLEEYLRPDLVVEGESFPSRWVVRRPTFLDENPFVKAASLEIMDSGWYRGERLAELHYKSKDVSGRDYWRLAINGRTVALVVTVYRTFDKGRRIARLVVHPTYRGVGLGRYLVERLLAFDPDTDVVAAMARYNPVFARAGMAEAPLVEREAPDGLAERLTPLGFETTRWRFRDYCMKFAESKEVRRIIAEYVKGYPKHLDFFFVNLGRTYANELGPERFRAEIEAIPSTAGRFLWGLRPKSLARFKGPGGLINPSVLDGVPSRVLPLATSTLGEGWVD